LWGSPGGYPQFSRFPTQDEIGRGDTTNPRGYYRLPGGRRLCSACLKLPDDVGGDHFLSGLRLGGKDTHVEKVRGTESSQELTDTEMPAFVTVSHHGAGLVLCVRNRNV
jgi:hypothetical protein